MSVGHSADKKIVCVTGGTGFIGSYLLPALLSQKDIGVRVLQRSVAAKVSEQVTTFSGDLLDRDSLAKFLSGAHSVINLALPSVEHGEKSILAVQNLAQMSRHAGVKRMLHISTAMVVGSSGGTCVNEDTLCKPINAYERHKFLAEQVIQQELAGSVDLGILRPTAVFGTGGKNLLKLIGVIAQAAPWYRLLLRFVHGDRRMHLVSVEDVVAAIVFLTMSARSLEGNIFLISADHEPCNNYQAIDAILGGEMGKPMPKRSMCLPHWGLRLLLALAGRSQSNPQLIYDSSKLQSWGFQRKTDFESDVKRFAYSYKAESRS
ncbi:NAD(P)-dependent oxidoreductase [Pseudomonas sp. 2FG]|uniref:NAD-dependent epimerase/dehydratase family protein n=1 Tax=Pseudomonas sp. 2FG TaxID=2502191 RepID=UPI0010F7F343|nr:NAD-dependent epimerase/dehydratase family protein [Pseudomonas sp. 2FG]